MRGCSTRQEYIVQKQRNSEEERENRKGTCRFPLGIEVDGFSATGLRWVVMTRFEDEGAVDGGGSCPVLKEPYSKLNGVTFIGVLSGEF